MSVALEVLDVLMSCGCMQYARSFAGLTLEKFYAYTWADLKRILPADVEGGGEELARKIEQEISNYRSKSAESSSGSHAVDDDDDELTIIEVITKADRRQMVKTEVIESVSDDDDEAETDVLSGNESSDSDDSKEDNENPKTLKIIVLSPNRRPQIDPAILSSDIYVHAQISKFDIVKPEAVHYCEMDDVVLAENFTQWNATLASFAPHITKLEMFVWTWGPLESNCPFNLFKILSNKSFTNLSQLILSAPITIDERNEDFRQKFDENFRLPKLNVLKIFNPASLDCRKQLKEILRVALNIEMLEFSFEDSSAVDSFLNTLKNFSKTQPLSTLKVLSLKSISGSGYLTENHLSKLVKVNADGLNELEFDTGMYEDIEEATMQEIFQKFSKIKRFKIQRCFQGLSDPKPNITIKIPPMSKLTFIDLGSDYEFTSYSDDECEISPPTKKQKRQDEVNEAVVVKQMKPFPVNVKFTSLSKLTTMRLGNLFNIDDAFSFSSMPRLVEYRVGSRWDLSVLFPRKKNAPKDYPTMQSMQLPDSLQDPSFIKPMAIRFPNLVKCWIFLPTVQVIRTFCKVMEHSMLQELYLETQFDFASSLDSVLINKPSEIEVSAEEERKLKCLKEYRHWEQFVLFHHIQVPPEDLSSLEGEEYAGLECLRNLKHLEIEHIPRILRIPRGPLHWDAKDCYITDEYIGFKKYPWPELHQDLRDYFRSRECPLLALRFIGFNGPVKFLQGQVYLRSNSVKMNTMGMVTVPKKEK